MKKQMAHKFCKSSHSKITIYAVIRYCYNEKFLEGGSMFILRRTPTYEMEQANLESEIFLGMVLLT